MFNGLITYFVPPEKLDNPDTLRRYKLVVSIFFITALFNLNYMCLTILMKMQEGTVTLALESSFNLILPFFIRRRANLILTSNIYVCCGVLTVLICMWFSGGFASPVLPWLGVAPIVALLMAGRISGWAWGIFSAVCMVVLGLLSYNHYAFPEHYDKAYDNYFHINCFVGLVLIIFMVALVLEKGRKGALKRLAESSLLLAEEKKKTALLDISQEIHDNVGQTLSVVKLNLHLLTAVRDTPAPAQVQEMMELVGKAIHDLRNMSRNLYTDNIQDFNLLDSLREELVIIARTGVFRTDFSTLGDYQKLDARSELILFRIAKEALNNIIKHSHARNIGIKVRYEPAVFSLLITDDGIGFNSEDTGADGQGLRNMRDRAKLLNGRFSSRSVPGSGTEIAIAVPVGKKS